MAVVTIEKLEALKQEMQQKQKSLEELKLKSKATWTPSQHNEWVNARYQQEWCDDCLETIKENAKKIRQKCKLGRRFELRNFESFDAEGDQNALETCKRYTKNLLEHKLKGKNSLVLYGDNGIGKTHLAAAIANEVIDNGVPAIFVTYSKILSAEKNAFGKATKDIWAPYVSLCCEIPLLIIDDLGKENTTAWSEEVLFTIINSRYEALLPTVITTNYSIGEMKQNFGKAIFSRLLEMSVMLGVKGEDRRLKICTQT